MKAALSGSDIRVAESWSAFWLLAAPLSREMLVKHDALGNERLMPERDNDYYEEKFFSGDCVGLIRQDEGGQPLSASILKRVDADTVEHVLRLGFSVRKTDTRKLLWSLGYRKLVFETHGSKEAPLINRLERRHKGKHRKLVSQDEAFGYSRYEVALDNPTKENFDDSNPS